MPESPANSRSPLEKVLGRLIKLFRESPGREDLVRDVMRRVEGRTIQHPARIEAGIENTWGVDGDTLKERLLLRKVDAIHVSPGATPDELRALARALAEDEGAVPSSEHITVELVTTVVPGSLDAPPPAPTPPRPVAPAPPAIPLAAPSSGRRPAVSIPAERPEVVASRILAELPAVVAREQWHRVLHDLDAAIRLINRLPEAARRTLTIALKRVLTAKVIDALIEQAYRLTEDQARTAEVLRGAGLQAAERVLDVLQRAGTIGPRAFLLEAVAGVQELLPNFANLAKSPNPHEAWLAAEMLGRIGLPEAVPILSGLVRHPEERVRLAAIEALGRYSEKGVVEALRAGLTHEAPGTRARAGRVLAARGSRAIAMPLIAALEAERDHAAWETLLESIASLGTPEGPVALARMVLEPGGRLGYKGGQVKRQLAVVRALAAAPGEAARQALESIAAGGQGEVQELARSLLAGG